MNKKPNARLLAVVGVSFFASSAAGTKSRYFHGHACFSSNSPELAEQKLNVLGLQDILARYSSSLSKAQETLKLAYFHIQNVLELLNNYNLLVENLDDGFTPTRTSSREAHDRFRAKDLDDLVKGLNKIEADINQQLAEAAKSLAAATRWSTSSEYGLNVLVSDRGHLLVQSIPAESKLFSLPVISASHENQKKQLDELSDAFCRIKNTFLALKQSQVSLRTNVREKMSRCSERDIFESLRSHVSSAVEDMRQAASRDKERLQAIELCEQIKREVIWLIETCYAPRLSKAVLDLWNCLLGDPIDSYPQNKRGSSTEDEDIHGLRICREKFESFRQHFDGRNCLGKISSVDQQRRNLASFYLSTFYGTGHCQRMLQNAVLASDIMSERAFVAFQRECRKKK